MSENASSSIPAVETDSNRGRGTTIVLQMFLLTGEALALMWLVDRLAAADWVQAVCLSQFILAMAGASASIYCAHIRRRKYDLPMERLQKLLPEIRAGRAPLDELSKIEGQIGPIARQFEELLRDLRTQKTMLTDMDHEVRQRIANKTEALERKIGSLRQQATRDALTGLLNRRALDEHLALVLKRSAAKGLPAGVLMIDVDNFKPLNDTLGHAAGDELLRSIGQILRSTLRDTDTAFRCGGDEFVVVLESSDSTAAKALADRLTSLIDGLAKTIKVAKPPRLSIGFASTHEVAEPTAEALLQEADKRLYVVKGDRKRGGATPAVQGATPMRKSA